MNTKDPTLYQRLHQAAVERFIEENAEAQNQTLHTILSEQQEDINELFPNFTDRLLNNNQIEEAGEAEETTNMATSITASPNTSPRPRNRRSG